MKRTLIMVLVLLFSLSAHAAHLTRTEDVDGWTEFAPSAADVTQVVYISVADGNDSTCAAYVASDGVWSDSGDPFEPNTSGTTPTPCETYAVAVAKVDTGDPDWVLFKRGETWTFTDTAINNPPSGKDADEPFLISAYGTTGAAPLLQTGIYKGFRVTANLQYFALVGIDFYAHLRNPGDGGSLSAGDHGIYVLDASSPWFTFDSILIEGNIFRWYRGNTITNSGFASNSWDIEMRRNIIINNYEERAHGDGGLHSQGLFTSGLDDVLFEGNILYHNGWYQQSALGDDDKEDGQATQYNHGMYWSSNENIIVKKNMYIDNCSAGIKLTGEYIYNSTQLKDNLFIGNEFSVGIGNNYQTDTCSGVGTPGDCCTGVGEGCEDRFGDTTIIDNVFSNGGRGDHNLNDIATGVWLTGLKDSTVANNLFINQDATVANGTPIRIASDIMTDTSFVDNVVFNWGLNEAIGIGAGAIISTGVTFTDNILQIPDITNDDLVSVELDATGIFTFDGNKYYADSTTWNDNSSAIANLAAWNALDYVTTDSWGEHSFTADTRDIPTYMTSIGETATIAAFIALLIAQDKYAWDSDLNTATVNDWIRVGFDLTEYGVAANPTMKGVSINN